MKSNSLGLGIIPIAALAFLWSPVARAETIYLKCSDPYVSPFVVDLTGKTVSDSIPGEPPDTAIITPVSIDWTEHGEGAHNDFHIDRSAGTLTVTTVEESSGRRFVSVRGLCTQVAAPQTKF